MPRITKQPPIDTRSTTNPQPDAEVKQENTTMKIQPLTGIDARILLNPALAPAINRERRIARLSHETGISETALRDMSSGEVCAVETAIARAGSRQLNDFHHEKQPQKP